MGGGLDYELDTMSKIFHFVPSVLSILIDREAIKMIDCACIDSDYGEGEPAQCFNAVKIKSRKKHNCSECGRTIENGEIYERATGKWDVSWDIFKTCDDCLSVREAFFCSYIFGCLWVDLGEYLTPGECLDKQMLKITPRAREKILEIIDIEDDRP